MPAIKPTPGSKTSTYGRADIVWPDFHAFAREERADESSRQPVAPMPEHRPLIEQFAELVNDRA